MSGRIDSYIRTDEHVIAYRNPGTIYDDQVNVGKQFLAHRYIVAEIAMERRNNGTLLAYASKKLA